MRSYFEKKQDIGNLDHSHRAQMIDLPSDIPLLSRNYIGNRSMADF